VGGGRILLFRINIYSPKTIPYALRIRVYLKMIIQ
jgi:hypothetical protein